MVKVSVVECEDYKQKNVDKAVKEALKLIDFKRKPKTIIIKPNILGGYALERAVTTHPSVVEAICKYFKNSKIVIGESSFFNTGKAFRVSGIEKVAKKYNCKVEIFETAEKRKVETGNKYLGAVYLPEIIFKADLLINVPKLKTHALTKYTGAVKNLYGVIPGAKKQHLHAIANNPEKFGDLMAGLYNIVKPGLNIMDGIIGMEGVGPATGSPIKTGLVFASENAVALDMAASETIGLKPETVVTTKACLSKKYFDGNYERVGSDKRVKYKIPGAASGWTGNFLTRNRRQKVYIDKSRCLKCGICRRHCPVKAIDEDYNIGKNCISCFCCVESCPNKAVLLKGNWAVNTVKLIGKILGK